MTLVFVNGCFDIIHVGHIELFKYASSLGDLLMVALDSDDKVKTDKGGDRPINNLIDRLEIVRSIKYVDSVSFFNNKEQLEGLVKLFRPDIMVVGSDWRGKQIVGSQHAGEVKYFDRIPGYSTSATIESIADR